jgi:hypothetical protein
MSKLTKRSKILKAIKDDQERDKRGPVTFSLNLALYRRFKDMCDNDGQPASAIIEKFIQGYVGE